MSNEEMLNELYSDPDFLAHIEEEEERALETMMEDFATQYQGG